MTRIYQPITLNTGSLISLTEKASHHLSRVLRATENDQITLFNGEGGEYTALIKKITKKIVDVEITHFNSRDAESPLNIYLAQGISRGEKMDFIIQKAVELGVKKIIPLITERCNVRLDQEREEKRMQHWQGVIISASEQSGRNRLAEIVSPLSLEEWLPQAKADKCFVLSPHVAEKLPTEARAPTSIALLIGPEGGLSDREVQQATQQGFLPLNLGPRILRTETAPLAAISVLQFKYGDLSAK